MKTQCAIKDHVLVLKNKFKYISETNKGTTQFVEMKAKHYDNTLNTHSITLDIRIDSKK